MEFNDVTKNNFICLDTRVKNPVGEQQKTYTCINKKLCTRPLSKSDTKWDKR